MNLKLLKEPFKAEEVEWRLATADGNSKDGIWGYCLAYIDARAIMDRLDDVCGAENWGVNYRDIPGGILCELSIRVGEDDWVLKCDGSDLTDIEPFKGGISGALKRAGAVWGIGRYLYRLESGGIRIVTKSTPGARRGQTKTSREVFYWLPPELPEWALPKKSPSPSSEEVLAKETCWKLWQERKGTEVGFAALIKKVYPTRKGPLTTQQWAQIEELIATLNSPQP
jgi:hypothetical protein